MFPSILVWQEKQVVGRSSAASAEHRL